MIRRISLLLILTGLLLTPATARDRKAELSALLKQGVVVYYGAEPQDKTKFTRARVVILEPSHWSTRSIRKLREEGKVVLGYLSVGELISTTRTRKNYRALSQNSDWNSMRVDPADPNWRQTMIRRTKLARERELDGLMLDTVDIVALHPEAVDGMADLIREIREEMPDGFIVTNRGFLVLDKVRDSVDGVLFENANNRAFCTGDREWVEAQCALLKRLGMAVVILDYAEHCDPGVSEAMASRYDWASFLAPSVTLAKQLQDDE